MEAIIEVSGLRKRYGSTVALDGMTFTVRPGQVTGFVGPNGAGKSTTMRILVGLDRADDGRALLANKTYHDLSQPLKVIGTLLDAAAIHPARSGRNHLLWLAQSQRIPTTRVDQLLDEVGLADNARRRAGGYSLGMRQRLGVAAALLGDPPIMILDEPFNGLDPAGFVWMRDLLRTRAEQGRAVLVSSHLMGELQDLAGHVIVVGRGRVVADAPTRQMRDEYGSLESAYLELTR